MNDEVELFCNLVETIVRKRDNLTVVCMANKVTICNPYFEYFKIYPNFDNDIKTYKDGLISVEISSDEEFIKEKEETRWGKILKGTKIGDHIINNKSLDSNEFDFVIPKRDKKYKFLFSIVYKNSEIGVWNYLDEFYCDRKIINTSKLRYCLTSDDMTPNLKMVHTVNKSPLFYSFKSAFKNGNLYYCDKYVKEEVYNILRFIGVR